MRPRRPDRYQVRVTAPDFIGHAIIERGFCTEADAELAPWIGCSAAWIYGRIRWHGWYSSARPLSQQFERSLAH